MSQIIQTSDGPAIFTDDSRIITTNDLEGLRQQILTDPQIVTALVDALDAKVQAIDSITRKVAGLQVIDQAEYSAIWIATKCVGSIGNIASVINALPGPEEAHSHE